MACKLLCCLLWLMAQLYLSLSGEMNSLESVPDLEKLMYVAIDGYPCVRLLNLSGEIGCSNPGRDKVVAPIVRFKNADKLAQPSTVLVSLNEVQSLFTRILNDSTYAKNIGGVLVESKADQNELNDFSPVEKFPQAEFAPYRNVHYEWNPIGNGIMLNAYNFPVFLLSQNSTSILREAAMKNEEAKKSYTTDVAEFNLVMQTTKAGTHDSKSCLKEGTCLPLGGYSVWSSLPPINISSTQSKPIILLVASMDSASFFRDKSHGADSPVSGLIALVAAVDALSRVDGLDDLNKQLVFLIFTGEAWGYLGSRRFLLELDLQTDAVNGLNSTLIDMVMEVGSVGKGSSQGVNTFYTHATMASSATNQTMAALQRAQDSLNSEDVKILPANSSNPGIPPSSLMGFLKKNTTTAGIVFEDFNTAFANKFYHSHLDDLSNVNSSSIEAASTIIARTLYILASKDTNISNSTLTAINANVSLIEELLGCLLSCEPGLSCDLVKNYIIPTTTSTCPSNYVGVLLGEPSSAPSPGTVNDVSRFLWNFLAEKTAISKGDVISSCKQNCSKKDQLCVREKTDGKGVCVTSTTRYVPAYSTRLKYESGIWDVLPADSSDPMGMLDPVWTESFWDVIGLRVYTVQDTGYDHLVLAGGIAVTVSAYVAIVVARAFITKALKRD